MPAGEVNAAGSGRCVLSEIALYDLWCVPLTLFSLKLTHSLTRRGTKLLKSECCKNMIEKKIYSRIIHVKYFIHLHDVSIQSFLLAE